MADNKALHRAKRQKKDEFYTQLVDIENEMRHYKPHFKGKTIYCNCDDPWESNFFKFFAANFNSLKLKKLIATSYAGSPIAGTQLAFDDIGVENGRRAHKIEITEVSDHDGDQAVGLSDVEWLLKNKANTAVNLQGGGDFRSPECVALLEEADIVVTNPPFSLFREYFAQLIEHDKEFLILGSKNVITYKEVFPFIKDGRVWVGHTPMSKNLLFDIPPEVADDLVATKKEGSGYRIVYGRVMGRSASSWFTNLDHPKRHEPLPLWHKYNPDDYPHYDNYDAIDVSSLKGPRVYAVNRIPCDWDGVMGVPITFLDKHNPGQFEIVDANAIRVDDSVPLKAHGLIKDKESAIEGKPKYVRIAVRRIS